MKHYFILMIRRLGKYLPSGKKVFRIALITWLSTVIIYWFNLENKLLYYGVRPLLSRHYDNLPRDRRL